MFVFRSLFAIQILYPSYQKLAENRCKKVKDELVKLGMPEKDIIMNPVGGVKELNPTEYDRRVLIHFTKE